MQPDPGHADFDTLCRPLLAKPLRKIIERKTAGNSPLCPIGLIAGRAEQYVQCIADDFRDRALVFENDLGHSRQVTVQHVGQYAWFQRFRQSCEPRDICEHGGDLTALSAEFRIAVVARQLLREAR
jgi:hypothetical protein